MLNRIVVGLPILAFAMAAGSLCAQTQEAPKSAEPSKFYKLEFVVKEVEGGKVLNARSYSMTVVADGRENASIRTGSKIPVATGGTGTTPNQYSQYQFVDVGVSIDARSVKEVQRDLALYVSADISNMASEPRAPLLPTVRQNKWSSPVIVPLKKPTLIFSSDDVASKRQVQLELTATPIM